MIRPAVFDLFLVFVLLFVTATAFYITQFKYLLFAEAVFIVIFIFKVDSYYRRGYKDD